MNKALTVTHTRTHLGVPLAVLDGLPGGGAELQPAELRALSAALLRIAADSESRPQGRSYMRGVQSYALEVTANVK